MNYNDFLKSKSTACTPAGFDPQPFTAELFPFQRDIVTMACRVGRFCIWADCGMGKTAMQLEWAHQVHHQTGGNPEPCAGPFTEFAGENPPPKTGDQIKDSINIWQRYASPVWMDINPSDTLQYRSARANEDERHICPLQLEVIRRGLQLWSNPGDVVLSPFAGIGSEGYCSLQMGRRFVGFELKPSYFNCAVKNLQVCESAKQGELV